MGWGWTDVEKLTVKKRHWILWRHNPQMHWNQLVYLILGMLGSFEKRKEDFEETLYVTSTFKRFILWLVQKFKFIWELRIAIRYRTSLLLKSKQCIPQQKQNCRDAGVRRLKIIASKNSCLDLQREFFRSQTIWILEIWTFKIWKVPFKLVRVMIKRENFRMHRFAFSRSFPTSKITRLTISAVE